METAGIRASTWVVGKALSPLSGGVLEAWAASTNLGSNIKALKLGLLQAQAMLHKARDREIHNPALGEMLDMLRQLAYRADDVLDELDYFRIQDELDGTYHAADAHAGGCVQDLALNARHTARACVNKLKFPVCTRPAPRDDPADQQDGGKKGCFSGLRLCGRREICSSPPSPANQLRIQEVPGGCRPSLASRASNATCNVGKHFSCCSLLPASVNHDAQNGAGPSMSKHRNNDTEIPKLKFDRVKMSTEILDIIQQLTDVCAHVSTNLNLELLNSSRTPTHDIAMNRPETTSQIIEPKLYGRENHTKIVADEIVNSECCELTVLPIVGPGGIGKTTFTQHIYEQMKCHFQVSIWTCVSLNFNANRLAKDIVNKIPEVNNENKNCSEGELIEQRLKEKRVLLVLDDVWPHHENEWKKLLAPFKKAGGKGSMVIVTTRIPKVANMVRTTKYSLELGRLSPKDIMSFFEEWVFDNEKPWVGYEGLYDVGCKIVEKLKGSPLAAKTVGRLLKNKLTLNHWRNVLESKEWELETNENDIMPALKLSYDYLPFHLQQCFSCCALFPEDYEFGDEELVHLWIGLDFLRSCEKRKRIEDVGLCYLNDLVNQGFFKINKKENGRSHYVIHDLLHELAVKVSSYECVSIYSSNARDVQIPPTIRHLSINIDNTDVNNRMSFEDYDGNLSALGKKLEIENLRTLMLFGDYHGSFAKTFCDLFKEARALRVISLSKASYNVEDMLQKFSELVHLRYIRIESVDYWRLCLPSALFRLYHLEVIDVQNNDNYVCSTRHMSNLIKLRHFLVPKVQYDICGVGKLKFLQELKEFRVGKESEGFELSQLGALTEIGGSLGIYNLEKVQTKEEANELKLIHKNHVRELTLEWDARRSNKDPVQEETVLGSLAPHGDLQELSIKGHGGINCPAWLCVDLSVKNLGSLCLDGVSWKSLPPFGELWMVNELGEEYQDCSSITPPSFHNLKKLELNNISNLTKWVGNGPCPFFSHLEVLVIKHCSQLMELPFCESSGCQVQLNEKVAWFPKLCELVIVDCLKLELLPPIPWQAHAPFSASIERVESVIQQRAYPSRYGPILNLQIQGKGALGDKLWSRLNFSNLTGLKELHMNKIPPLPLDDLLVLTSLKMITISLSSSVLPPIEGDGHGRYQYPVEVLSIIMCDTSGKELTLLLSFLPNLSKLRIDECENITALGVVEHAETVSGEQQQQTGVGEEEPITAAAAEGLLLLPPLLQELRITYCPKVSLLPNPPPDDHAEAAARGGREGGLRRLRSLRSLDVYDSPEFLSSYSSSSSSFPPFPTCLQHLSLYGVRYMETLQALSNLTSLTELELHIPGDSRSDGLWPLLAHGRLTKLTLFTASDFFAGSDPSRPHDAEVFSSSSKLVYLETPSNTGFLAAPICSLFSSTLTRLQLMLDDEEAERLTKEQEEALQLLTSLQELKFSWGGKLQRLPAGLHKLISLKKLAIMWCSAIRSLPSLPSSLQELEISDCGAIKSLPNTLPSSLERLEISDCGAIKSLPKDGLPSSMLELVVWDRNSEELKRECRKLIGTIPIIKA